jgi:hypothetical protein
MNFVYLHIALFTVWMLFIEGRRLIDHRAPQQ